MCTWRKENSLVLDLILVKDQTRHDTTVMINPTIEFNDPPVCSGLEEQTVFTRATDADSSNKLKACAVFVEQDSTVADTAYVQTTDSLTLGTSNIVFSQFSSAGEVLAGTGLSKSGNTISASVDDTFIEVEAGSLTVKEFYHCR